MEALGEQAGIHPGYVDNIAKAVHAGEDLNDIQLELQASLMKQGLSQADAATKAEELMTVYHDEIAAMEQLNDAQQNIDFDKIAEDQLTMARGADIATAALVAQAEAELGPNASSLEVWQRYVELQGEATQAAEEAAEAEKLLAEETQGAVEAAQAMGSADWGKAALDGATTAMSAYTEQLFASANMAEAETEAIGKLGTALTDTAIQFDTNTEAGIAQSNALEELAGVVDTKLAQAYADAGGSFDEFAQSAEEVRSDTIARLMTDLGLTAEEATLLVDQLGTMPEDIESRYELAGAEEARLQLGLLSGAISGLPPEVETRVNQQILAGDYVAARDEIQTFYDDNPTFVSTSADMEGFTSQVDETLGAVPDAVIYTGANTEEAREENEDAAEAAPEAEIVTDADTSAAAKAMLDEASKFRVAYIYAYARTSVANQLLADAARARTADITANAHTGDAEYELNHTARTRTAHINVQTHGVAAASQSIAAIPGVNAARSAQQLGAAPAPMATTVAPINVTINTAVIGNRYDVARVVTEATRTSTRLAGRRLAAVA
jgi:hypothetical protein